MNHTPQTQDEGVKLEGLEEEPAGRYWEDILCVGCGSGERDESIILCDGCDAGWHFDCLTPPLPRIPAGEWHCPHCLAGVGQVRVCVREREVERERESV